MQKCRCCGTLIDYNRGEYCYPCAAEMFTEVDDESWVPEANDCDDRESE